MPPIPRGKLVRAGVAHCLRPPVWQLRMLLATDYSRRGCDISTSNKLKMFSPALWTVFNFLSRAFTSLKASVCS
ncbi:hypothetical protein KC348_g20 [Hortaea werneckii]|nr:hypothetical protein KC348_g20 [Hortaea werneckii]